MSSRPGHGSRKPLSIIHSETTTRRRCCCRCTKANPPILQSINPLNNFTSFPNFCRGSECLFSAFPRQTSQIKTRAVSEIPRAPAAMAAPAPNETLGQTLIPIINKIQDIFSQVRFRPRGPGDLDAASLRVRALHLSLPTSALKPLSLTFLSSQISPDVRLDLPQVVVVGSQSSGKSSVLEALVSTAPA